MVHSNSLHLQCIIPKLYHTMYCNESERSMEPFSDKSNYNTYEVLKPFEVKSGQIAPYYFQKGGGTQYLLEQSVKWYRTHGFLRLINGK